MRTTLTQRIAAAEALISTQSKELTKRQVTINKLVAERDDLKILVDAMRVTARTTLSERNQAILDNADTQVDNDRLQGRLASSESRLEAIRNLPHPWWIRFYHPRYCPICLANVASVGV